MTVRPRDQDLQVGHDIRVLGRLLGDLVRDQAVDEVFDLIDTVRQAAVTARRDDPYAFEAIVPAPLKAGIDVQLHLIRAFAWISLLANTAEDVHPERRRRFHRASGSGTRRAAWRPTSTTSAGAASE